MSRVIAVGAPSSAEPVHHAMTLEEHEAARGGYVDPDRYREGHRDYSPEVLCRTGAYHKLITYDWPKVTCSRCLARMPRIPA